MMLKIHVNLPEKNTRVSLLSIRKSWVLPALLAFVTVGEFSEQWCEDSGHLKISYDTVEDSSLNNGGFIT